MERRLFNRIEFTTQAELRAGQSAWQTDIIELSLKGALLQRPPDFKVEYDTDLSLHFSLQGMDTPICMQGKIRHADQQLLGFQCEMFDIDSATELRRLIELNLADESLLQRDLAALIHGNQVA